MHFSALYPLSFAWFLMISDVSTYNEKVSYLNCEWHNISNHRHTLCLGVDEGPRHTVTKIYTYEKGIK